MFDEMAAATLLVHSGPILKWSLHIAQDAKLPYTIYELLLLPAHFSLSISYATNYYYDPFLHLFSSILLSRKGALIIVSKISKE